MSVTRVPLCSVKWCPAPSSPDFHVCWVCEATDHLDHQHIIPRGMGGSPSRRDDPDNIVILCRTCHERITLHDWSNAIIDTEAITGTPPFYRVWNLKNETIIERPLRWWQNEVQAPGSRDAGILDVRRQTDLAVVPRLQDRSTSYETWCEEIRRLGFVRRSLGWAIGDKIVEGEDAFGRDETWSAGILEELGVSFETLANMASVARAIPQSRRDERLSFSTYSALAPIFRRDHEEGLAWVERAIAEELSSREIRALLAPPRDVTEHKCCRTD